MSKNYGNAPALVVDAPEMPANTAQETPETPIVVLPVLSDRQSRIATLTAQESTGTLSQKDKLTLAALRAHESRLLKVAKRELTTAKYAAEVTALVATLTTALAPIPEADRRAVLVAAVRALYPASAKGSPASASYLDLTAVKLESIKTEVMVTIPKAKGFDGYQGVATYVGKIAKGSADGFCFVRYGVDEVVAKARVRSIVQA